MANGVAVHHVHLLAEAHLQFGRATFWGDVKHAHVLQRIGGLQHVPQRRFELRAGPRDAPAEVRRIVTPGTVHVLLHGHQTDGGRRRAFHTAKIGDGGRAKDVVVGGGLAPAQEWKQTWHARRPLYSSTSPTVSLTAAVVRTVSAATQA